MNTITLRRLRLALIAATMACSATAALADGPFQFYPLTPCRIADTRNAGNNGSPALAGGVVRNMDVQGLCGVPIGAKAVSVNITIVSPSIGGWVTIWPSGIAQPVVSTINFSASDPPTANGAIVALSVNDEDLSVQNAFGTVHVILDVTGYFQ